MKNVNPCLFCIYLRPVHVNVRNEAFIKDMAVLCDLFWFFVNFTLFVHDYVEPGADSCTKELKNPHFMFFAQIFAQNYKKYCFSLKTVRGIREK